MKYRIVASEPFQRGLDRLDNRTAERINDGIERLAESLDEVHHPALKGRFRGLLKLRVGDYRVTYTIEREAGTLTVHLVGHRSEIYDITMEDNA